MNKGIRSIVFLLTLAVSVAASATALKVTVGPFETDVKDYPVVLRLANYDFTFEERAQLGVYTNGRKGKEIPSQLDDNLNNDSVPDELAFLVDLKKGEIALYFPEMLKAAQDCRFTPCTHTHEPGCAVKEAVEAGEISYDRYSSYLGMLDEEGKYR